MAELDRRVVVVWRWTTIFWGTCFAALTAAVAFLALDRLGPLAFASVPLVFLITALAAWLGPTRVWSHWSYELTDDALELSHGVLFHEHSVVPWSRVQHVDVSHGPLDRRYGLAQLKIHTASAKTDAKLPGIDAVEAESIRLDILDRYRRTTGPS